MSENSKGKQSPLDLDAAVSAKVEAAAIQRFETEMRRVNALDQLRESNVPEQIAQAAAEVISRDNGTLPNLGRTPEDTKICKQAMEHYWRGQRDKQ